MGSQGLYVRMLGGTVGLLFLQLLLGSVLGSLLHIEEFSVTYNQSVELDPFTEDVINHVPRHQRDGRLFRDTTKIENRYLGISVWKEEDENHCYFRELMDYESPILLSQIAVIAEANQDVFNAADMTQVLLWATPNGQLTDDEREKLTMDMKLLCTGIKIVRMKTEHLDPEEYAHRKSNVGDCYSSQTGLNNVRGKRDARPAAIAHESCSSCAGGNRELYLAQLARGGSRRKRSLGVEQMVHLVIGHKQYGCE